MKRQRQFVSWFMNYIWILLICAVLAVCVFRFVLSALNEQTNKTLQIASEQVKNFCDSELEKQQLSAYTVIKSNLGKFFFEYEEKTGYHRSNLVAQAIDDLSSAFENINSLTGCSVINENTDIGISFAGHTTKKEVWNEYFAQSYPDYQKWQKDIFNFDGNLQYMHMDKGVAESLLMIYKFVRGGSATVAIMEIPPEQFLHEAVGTALSKPLLYILSETGEVLLSNSDADIDDFEKGRNSLEIDGRHYFVAVTDSKTTNLSYMILLAQEHYGKRTQLVVGVCTLTMMLAMLLCIILAYFLARRQYRPIDRILSKIGRECDKNEKELFFLEKEFERIIEKNNTITTQLTQRGQKLRELSLANLIKYNKEIPPEQLFEKFGVDLRREQCAIIAFQTIDYGVFGKNGNTEISFVLTNVFSELMENTAQCYFLDVEKNHICIINSDDINVMSSIYESLEFLTGFIEEQFGLDVKCTVSKIGSLGKLPELYAQTQELLKLSNADWKIMLYDEILEYLSEEYSTAQENEEQLSLREDIADRIYEYIGENFNNPMLNISAIASEFDITINYLSRCFKKRYGVKPSEHLLKLRIDKASDMLVRTSLSVSEIGAQCGFLNTGMFIRSFKKVHGTTPGMYIETK